MTRHTVQTKNEWQNFAEHWVITMAERIAVAVIMFLGWQIWSDVNTLKANTPLIEVRVSSLEIAAKETREERGRLDQKRDGQYDSLKDELAELKVGIAEGTGKGEATAVKIQTLTDQVQALIRQIQNKETMMKGKTYGRL